MKTLSRAVAEGMKRRSGDELGKIRQHVTTLEGRARAAGDKDVADQLKITAHNIGLVQADLSAERHQEAEKRTRLIGTMLSEASELLRVSPAHGKRLKSTIIKK